MFSLMDTGATIAIVATLAVLITVAVVAVRWLVRR